MSIITTSRSRSNIDLPEAFITEFPLPEEAETITLLTVAQFDKWAETQGLYDGVNITDRDALNAARSQLRYAINNVALGAPWREYGYDAYQIEVLDHGETYKVVRAVTGFLDVGHNLPRKVRATASGRKKLLKTLLAAVAPDDLSIELRIEAHQQITKIEEWEERAKLELNQMERNFRKLRQLVQIATPEAAKLIENHDDND